MTAVATLADELLARINCFGMGAWLDGVLAGSGQVLPGAGLASGALRSARLAPGLAATLGRVLVPQSDPRDSLVLARVEGDATAPMPRGLNPATETPGTAGAKLSTNTAGGSPGEVASGDRRVSFFLDGARVVELRFNPGLVGFDRIVLARLGVALDWRDPASR